MSEVRCILVVPAKAGIQNEFPFDPAFAVVMNS
jgi:hypothetical protein